MPQHCAPRLQSIASPGWLEQGNRPPTGLQPQLMCRAASCFSRLHTVHSSTALHAITRHAQALYPLYSQTTTGAIEGCRVALGPAIILNYLMQVGGW